MGIELYNYEIGFSKLRRENWDLNPKTLLKVSSFILVHEKLDLLMHWPVNLGDREDVRMMAGPGPVTCDAFIMSHNCSAVA